MGNNSIRITIGRKFHMYVAITVSGKARGIQFREKTHVVKTIDNYERMLAEDTDIIARLKAETIELTKAKKEPLIPITRCVLRGDHDL